MSYCDTCEYYDECVFADGTNFCEDCKYYAECRIRTASCEAGHDIECNNGFEDKNEYCCDDEKGGEDDA